MIWFPVVWSVAGAASLTLAFIHLGVWFQRRHDRAHLLFAISAASLAGLNVCEIIMMQAATVESFLIAHRWAHFAIFGFLVSLVWFARLHLQAGRLWLAWTLTAWRGAVLVLELVLPYGINFREVVAMRPVEVLGATVFAPEGVPWAVSRFAEVSALLVGVYWVDAMISVSRRGGNRTVRILWTSLILFLVLATCIAILIHVGAVAIPYLLSFPFLGVVASMGYELSASVVSAARLADRLRENEQHMQLAADAARLGMWRWDILRDEIWCTDQTPMLHGVSVSERIDHLRFSATVHPADQEMVGQLLKDALEGQHVFESEHRVLLPDGQTRWLLVRGRVERNASGVPVRMLGVSLDISARKSAELEALRLRNDAAHVSRVSVLGEFAASLAHELNQSLSAILSNAQAAQRFMAAGTPQYGEVRDALTEIAQDTNRAAGVIRQVRALARKGEIQPVPLNLNSIVEDVAGFLRGDAQLRGISIQLHLAPALPSVPADPIQVQQVLLNLLLNAFEAMNDRATERIVAVRTGRDGNARVVVSVEDRGGGIDPQELPKIFEPFYSSKSGGMGMGMGMGLAICRSIIEAHHGQLWAENNLLGGATMSFALPVAQLGGAS